MADERIEIEIVLDDGSIRKGFTKVKLEADKVAPKISSSISKGFVTGLAKIGAALGGLLIIREITNSFREFGEALAEVRTITQGLDIDNAELRSSLADVSAQFGTTAAEQAKSFYQIISAGITDAAAANEVLIASNKLAIGGLTTAAGAVDLLTSAINAFGKANLTAARAADIIFGTVRLGKTRVDELQASLGQILPTAAALGVSFEDVAAGLAQLTVKGISTSEAITQLSAVFTAILRKQDTAVKLGSKVAEAFTLQALQAKGLTTFLKDLNDALGGSEEKLVELLGRVEGAKAIISLGADNFAGMADKVDQLKNSTGAADEAFKEMTNTLNFQLNRTLSIVTATILKLGNTTDVQLVGVFTRLNDTLISIVQGFGAFNRSIETLFFRIAISIKEFRLSLLELQLSAQRATGPLRELFARAFGRNAQDSVNAIQTEIARTRGEIDGLNESMMALGETTTTLSETAQEFIGPPIPPPDITPKINMEEFAITQQTLIEGFNATFTTIEQRQKQFLAESKRFIGIFRNAFVQGISSAFASFGSALASGRGGFKEFGKSILKTLGGLAIQLGQFFILVGAGLTATTVLLGVSGGAAIAAGIGLSILGGVLQSLGGGGGVAAGGAPGGEAGVAGGGPPTFETPEELEALPTTQVAVNIQGNVFDTAETGMRIVDIINESFDTEGTVIASPA